MFVKLKKFKAVSLVVAFFLTNASALAASTALCDARMSVIDHASFADLKNLEIPLGSIVIPLSQSPVTSYMENGIGEGAFANGMTLKIQAAYQTPALPARVAELRFAAYLVSGDSQKPEVILGGHGVQIPANQLPYTGRPTLVGAAIDRAVNPAIVNAALAAGVASTFILDGDESWLALVKTGVFSSLDGSPIQLSVTCRIEQ